MARRLSDGQIFPAEIFPGNLRRQTLLQSKNVVSKGLYEEGIFRRTPQKKRTMGQNKDRDAQFRNLKRLKQEYLAAGKPILGMDTRKKETLVISIAKG